MSGIITKDRLFNYPGLIMAVENNRKRLERLQKDTVLTGGSSATWEGDGSQRSIYVNTDQIPNLIIRKMEQIEKLQEKIRDAVREMQYIEDEIDKLNDPMHSEVLRLRYCDGDFCKLMPWEEVCEFIYHNTDEKYMKATYRLHGVALQALEKQTRHK